MSKLLSAPIPGQSLTRTPKNAPWEQPPRYSTPDEALMVYIKKYNEPDVLDDLLWLLEEGYPIRAFVEGATTAAVMKGAHSVDVSLIIAPILHEYIKSLATAAGIKYNEGFYADAEREKKDKEKLQASIRRKISEMSKQKKDAGTAEVEAIINAPAADAMPMEATTEAPVDMAIEEAAPAAPAPRGLMARKVM